MSVLPWLFCVVTAAGFGWMAHRARRSRGLWAAGGALLGLVAATMVEGLSQAAFIPMSHAAVVAFHFRVIVFATVSVGLLGWLCTFSLRRRLPASSNQNGREVQPVSGKKLEPAPNPPPKSRPNPEGLPAATRAR